ncbi:dienelactone hydrolase family protein [Methylobacterium durans]|uniref:alpha/beta hydrolase family protein n=1 Tax=Methylobacterium durans TaxID=2202825 RepID=UPI002AFE9470|nr:dienelactone hydrolase family protein [Methylobacterium durans]MEA1830732.1 dienelactone hydrolase family protein [Methylobacterium durans]
MPDLSPPAGTRETLSCAGHPLTIEVFAPPGKDGDTTRTIILLHDAAGAGPDRPVRREAATLARAGFAVLLPHYLGRTGQERAGFSEIARHFGAWRDSLADLLRQAGLGAAGGIGLCGRSLGGALALAIALEAGDVAALALRSAFIPPEIAGRALVLPPILAQHGSRDVLVPASHAARLAEGVATAGGSCRLALYPDQAHAFDARTDAAATAQAVAFLREHLRG